MTPFDTDALLESAKALDAYTYTKSIWKSTAANSDAKYKIGDKVTMDMRELDKWREFLKTISRAQPVSQSVSINPNGILSYDYIKDEQNNIAKTVIHWIGGVTTTCSTTLDKADQYTGFMIAVAKYAMGNGNAATNAADYWINKLPKKQAKELKETLKIMEQKKKIEEKRRKRKEKYRLHIAAIKRKEAYEAAKLANEKYGVPINFKAEEDN